MTLTHNGYMKYTLPDNWCAEYDSDILSVYDPCGEGAITISFYNLLTREISVEEQISIMAKKFIDKNSIQVTTPLILIDKDGKRVLRGTGTTADGWHIEIWVIAKYPKIVFATYQCEQKSKEVEVCDSIIDSIQFRNI